MQLVDLLAVHFALLILLAFDPTSLIDDSLTIFPNAV